MNVRYAGDEKKATGAEAESRSVLPPRLLAFEIGVENDEEIVL